MKVFFLMLIGLVIVGCDGAGPTPESVLTPAPKVDVSSYFRMGSEYRPGGVYLKIVAREPITIHGVTLNRGECKIHVSVENPEKLGMGGTFDRSTTCENLIEAEIDFGDQKRVYTFE